MPAHTLHIGLVRVHTIKVVRAFEQVVVKLALVGSGLWRNFAIALNSLLAGLGVNFSYRPDRSIPTPAYEVLRSVGALREGLAGGARYVSRVTGSHQRAAFRIDGYLQDRRRPNYPDCEEAGD